MPKVLYLDDEMTFLKLAAAGFPIDDGRFFDRTGNAPELDLLHVVNGQIKPLTMESIVEKGYDVVVTDYHYLEQDKRYHGKAADGFSDGVEFVRALRKAGFKGAVMLFTSLASEDAVRAKDKQRHPDRQRPSEIYDKLGITYCHKNLETLKGFYDLVCKAQTEHAKSKASVTDDGKADGMGR